MQKRWAFFLSLVLGVFAFGLEWHSIDESMAAKDQLTQAFVHLDPDNLTAAALRQADSPSAEALLYKSRQLTYFTMPFAAMSAICVYLSHRRKEPVALVWSCGVLLMLSFYIYGVIGPI